MMKSNMILLYMYMMSPFFINFLMIMLLMAPKKSNYHPISLLIMLILMTFLISIMMNLIFYSLMSFILFLAMIGGLMIIFLYITSLTNNEFFFINFNMIIINLTKILPMTMILMYMLYLYYPQNYFMNLNIQESWKINMFQFMNNQSNINILYTQINNKSSMLIMMYIYFTMICVMNICYKLKAPLRQLMF